jgi:hypothetical protein
LPRDEWYYIYRWGVSPVHLSGDGSPEAFYQKVGRQPVQRGRFLLYPHWRHDYEAMTRQALADIVIYVVGGYDAGPAWTSACRDFPFVNRKQGESKKSHVLRVRMLIEEAMRAGGTHLLVPREAADWLGDSPWLEKYFATHHEMVEASADTGIVFALDPRKSPGSAKR